MYQYFISFYCWMIFHYINVKHFVYSFIGCWTLGLFTLFSCLEWCCLSICVQFLCGHIFSFLMGIYLGVGFLIHLIALCLTSWGIFSKSTKAEPFYIPTCSVWGFQFLYLLANTCHCLSFWLQPNWWVWRNIALWFCCAFPWWHMMLRTIPRGYW